MIRMKSCKTIFEKGGFMKKSMLLMVAVVLLSLVCSAVPALAAGSDTAEISLRCTVTLSVSLVGGSTSFYFGDLSAASTNYSDTPIVFKNDSTGAICRWDLNVENASLDGWDLGSAPGLDQVAIAGLFKKDNQPVDGDFDVVADSFSVVAKEYNSTSYYDADYESDGYGNDAAKILPETYAGTGSQRKLWLKLQTPLAVTDENSRRIQLTVTASTAN